MSDFDPGAPAPATVVMYGDSETQLNGWTGALASDLGPSYRVVNTALAGTTSSWGLENLRTHVLDYRPQVVVFEFSMNDAVWLTLDQAKANTVTIIDELRAEDPGVRIFLATNNEPSAAAVASTLAKVPASHLADVDAYYAQYRAVAAAEGVGLIDNEPAWRAAQAADPSIVPDGFHPTYAADLQVEVPVELAAIQGVQVHPAYGHLPAPHHGALS